MYSEISSDKGEVLKGIILASDLIGSTIGPAGRSTLMRVLTQVDKKRTPDGKVRSVKDGVTIAKHLAFREPLKDYGCKMVVSACEGTLDRVGDGTTQTAVMAGEICRLLDGIDGNVHSIKRGMQAAAEDIIRIIEDNSLEMIVDKEIQLDELRRIATISANGDPIGEKIADLVAKVGRLGRVNVMENNGIETKVEFRKGMFIDFGLASPYFRSNEKGLDVANPYILIFDTDIFNFAKHLAAAVKAWQEKSAADYGPLIIFCRKMRDNAMSTVRHIVESGQAPIAVISMPGDAHEKAEMLKDLEYVTGAVAYSSFKGLSEKDFDPKGIGRANHLFADMKRTVLSFDKDISERLERLEAAYKETGDELLKQRMASMSGGIGTILVGGATVMEIETMKDTIDDVQRACFSSLYEGYVPGCGNALSWAGNMAMKGALAVKRNDDEEKGYSIVCQACHAPMKKIFENAGTDSPQQIEVLSESIDVFTGEPIDLIKEGIIDPTLSPTEALRNAVSVGIAFLEAENMMWHEQ